MLNYFKKIKNLEDLKNQYRALLKANHPDNGGDEEAMKEINVQFDALFAIWKNRTETQTGAPVNETADTVRTRFYTAYGWEGSNYKSGRTLKEISQIVRTYVKEKYPTYKFSVRTAYASMCQELHVELKESPIEIYKVFEELTSEDIYEIGKRLFPFGYMIDEQMDFLNSSRENQKKVIEESRSYYKNMMNDVTKAVVEDVDAFVKSYRYDDSDGMIDYFDTNFYYFGCCKDNGKNIKIVPKTARVKKETSEPAKAKKSTEPKQEQPEAIKQKTGYTYKITKGEDTRDGSTLWIVRIVENLDKAAYIAENKAMKERGA